MPASRVLATAVRVNTPSGKRRQAISGIVEHAASTTQMRFSSGGPGREVRTLPCERITSEPASRATASPTSRSARELGWTTKGLCADTDDDITLRVYLPWALLTSPYGMISLHSMGRTKFPSQGVSPALGPWWNAPMGSQRNEITESSVRLSKHNPIAKNHKLFVHTPSRAQVCHVRRRFYAMRALLRALLLLFPFLICSSSAVGQDTTGVGTIVGVVTGADQRPTAHVTVCVAGTTRCAQTDAVGGFRLADLRAGRYRLKIMPPSQPSMLSADVEVRAGVDTSLEVEVPVLQPLNQTITVTATATAQAPPDEIKTSGFLVPPEAVQDSAGALQDVSRYLQSLPGVVMGGGEERNDLIVRGGSPLENLFIVDNIEVPNINSFANFAAGGGLVSILDPALLRDVTFLTGGYPASYSNRLSSVLQIALRDGDREKFKGTATVGFAGAGLILEGPIRKSKGSWIISARRTFLDLFTNDIGPGGVPISYYLNVKALYDFTPRDRIWVENLTDIDSIHIGLHGRSLDNPTVIKEDIEQDILSRSSRIATGVSWQHIFGDHAIGLLGIAYSDSRPDFTVGDLLKPGSPLMYVDHSREGEATVKYDVTLERVPLFGTVQVGGILKRFALNYQVAAPSCLNSPYS